MRNGSVLRMGVRNEWGNNIIIFGLNDCSRWENAICISESDALLLNKGYIEDTWSIFDREVSLHDPRNLYYFLILWSILCFEIKARGHELFRKSFYFWFWWSHIDQLKPYSYEHEKFGFGFQKEVSNQAKQSEAGPKIYF